MTVIDRETTVIAVWEIEDGDMIDYREILKDLQLFGALTFVDSDLWERAETHYAGVQGVFPLGHEYTRVEFVNFPALVLRDDTTVHLVKP